MKKQKSNNNQELQELITQLEKEAKKLELENLKKEVIVKKLTILLNEKNVA